MLDSVDSGIACTSATELFIRDAVKTCSVYDSLRIKHTVSSERIVLIYMSIRQIPGLLKATKVESMVELKCVGLP